MFDSTAVRRNMWRECRTANLQSSVGSSPTQKGPVPWPFEAMSMTGKWLVRQAIDSQQARNATLPSHVDSPAVMYALVTMATARAKWASWEGTPIGQRAPNLRLFIHVLDRLATMALGAFCLPDPAYLNTPEDTTPHGLVFESQLIQTELTDLTRPLAQWRANTIAHLGAGFDRLSMAAIQCIEEFRYYETAGILSMLSDRLQAIEATINEELNRTGPTTLMPRLCITPSGGSDGQARPMGVQALQAANRVLMARAMSTEDTTTEDAAP